MRTNLVTGGAGFIGSHLVEELLKRGLRVKVLDNFLTGKRENINSLVKEIELIEGDIRNKETCREAVENVDCVFHLAALPSVPRSIEDPLLANEINVSGTINLLHASAKAGVKRFIFASSSSVYGDSPDLPKREGKEGNPLSPYAASKLAGEKYCQVFGQVFSLSTISLRYFNVFGPRQDPFSQYAAVIPQFITRMLAGKNPIIYGDGEQSRDFTYVSNVVEANLLAASADRISGEILNIACGERITVNQLARKINDILGTEISPFHDKPRPGDIRHSFADISKARELIGFEPQVGFEEGLELTINWYRERMEK